MKREARNRKRGCKDLNELDALRDPGLVEAVGEFTAETRQEKIRPDEGRGGEVRGRRRGGFRQLIDDQKAEGGFQEVVAEGGEELAQEQGRKPARRHQGREHRSPAVWLS